MNLTNVLHIYSWAGFNIQTILMDMEFEKIRVNMWQKWTGEFD